MALRDMEIKPLEGWLIADQARLILGTSKQTVLDMMEAGKFSTLHYIGNHSVYVVREEEVWEMKKIREQT